MMPTIQYGDANLTMQVLHVHQPIAQLWFKFVRSQTTVLSNRPRSCICFATRLQAYENTLHTAQKTAFLLINNTAFDHSTTIYSWPFCSHAGLMKSAVCMRWLCMHVYS